MVEQPKPALVEQWALGVWRDAEYTSNNAEVFPDQAAARVIETAFAEREAAKDAEIAECHAEINTKAVFIDATINQMAGKDAEIARLLSLAKAKNDLARHVDQARKDALANMADLRAHVAELETAIKQLGDQFAFYTQEHTAAGKYEKAATNQRFADLAAAILAKHRSAS